MPDIEETLKDIKEEKLHVKEPDNDEAEQEPRDERVSIVERVVVEITHFPDVIAKIPSGQCLFTLETEQLQKFREFPTDQLDVEDVDQIRGVVRVIRSER